MKQDLAMIAPPSAELSIDGEAVTVTPVTIGLLPPLLEVVEPLLEQLALLDPALVERLASGQAELDDVAQLVRLLARNGDQLIRAVALASRRPHDWVAQLLPDRFVMLAAACIRVNRDFFVHAAPSLKATFAALMPSAAATPATPA
ncbi:MAG: hypothetical protein ACKVQR_15005 [Aquabacterium sp.]